MTRSSKDKLNAHHLAGAIGLGAIVGAITGSATLFICVTAALIAASLATSEIRFRGGRR